MSWLTSFDSGRTAVGTFVTNATSANATCTLNGAADSLASGPYLCRGMQVKGFEKITIGLKAGDVTTPFDVAAEGSLDNVNWFHLSTAVGLDNNSDVIEITTPISFVRIRCNSSENVSFLCEYQAVRR